MSIGNRLLTNGTKVVPLGARAMDILMVLAEHADKVVSRRTLIERVWPKRGADEVSLRVHISALRKALAQNDPARRYIANVPGRGYSFVVPITSPSLETPESDLAARSWLPARLTRMVGRQDAVAAIEAKLAAQKFVTIVGPGGIGKTTVAVAVAHEMRSIIPGRVRLVDSGPDILIRVSRVGTLSRSCPHSARDAEDYICLVKNLNDGHRAIGEAVIILTSSMRQFRLDKIEVCCGLQNAL